MSLPGGATPQRRPRAGPVALLVFACLVPLAASDFQLFQLTQALIYAIALLGLNLLTGYNGQISLGHGAFYATGAYCAALLMHHWSVPYYLTLPPAGLLCLIAGFGFGLPALRLQGPYLAVATLALAVAVPQVLKHDALQPWTGGVQGIVVAKPHAPLGLPLSDDQWLYFFTLAITWVMFWTARNLLRGRIGRALVAIRDHHVCAQTLGIDTARYKATTFGVSAMYTGVAGALSAIVIQFVAPDSFHLLLSITFLVGIVVGGLGSISGALYGALFILFVPNVAQDISVAAPWAIYGLLLLAFVYAMPDGVAGMLGALARRWSRRRAAS